MFAVKPDFAASNINAVQISIFHTIFNITNTVILFPFAGQLVKLSGILVKEKSGDLDGESGEEQETLKHLDERIFESPAFALETAALEVIHMGQITAGNLEKAISALETADQSAIQEVYKTEKTINNMEKMLTEYLIKVDNLSLNEHQIGRAHV